MLIKIIKGETRQKSAHQSAVNLVRYILDANRKPTLKSSIEQSLTVPQKTVHLNEKVRFAGCHNMDELLHISNVGEHAQDIAQLFAEPSLAFQADQRRGKKTGKSTEHLLLTFERDETLTQMQCDHAVKTLLHDCGYGDLPCVWSAHSNTDNFHIHIAVQRWDMTHNCMVRTAEECAGKYLEKKRVLTMRQTVAKLEAEFKLNLRQTQSLQKAQHGNTPQNLQNSSLVQRSKRIDEPSYYEQLNARAISTVLSTAKSWDDIHTLLGEMGLTIKQRGSGAVLQLNKVDTIQTLPITLNAHVKLSGILPPNDYPDAQFKTIQSRVGPFTPANPNTPPKPMPLNQGEKVIGLRTLKASLNKRVKLKPEYQQTLSEIIQQQRKLLPKRKIAIKHLNKTPVQHEPWAEPVHTPAVLEQPIPEQIAPVATTQRPINNALPSVRHLETAVEPPIQADRTQILVEPTEKAATITTSAAETTRAMTNAVENEAHESIMPTGLTRPVQPIEHSQSRPLVQASAHRPEHRPVAQTMLNESEESTHGPKEPAESDAVIDVAEGRVAAEAVGQSEDDAQEAPDAQELAEDLATIEPAPPPPPKPKQKPRRPRM